jgi:hypothetical protein
MSQAESLRVGYVVKRYPRYSETFIVNEILAREAAGLEIEIFSPRPPAETRTFGMFCQGLWAALEEAQTETRSEIIRWCCWPVKCGEMD